MINGVPNSYFSFSNNPLALAGQIQQALKDKGPNYVPPQTMPAAAIASSGSKGFGSTNADFSSTTRHARRIYAGSIPANVTEQELVDFFNRVVTEGLYPLHFDTPPVIKAYLNLEKVFAFVELISIELATACMVLDGIRFEHWSGPYTLRIRRPNDYRPELVPKDLAPIPEFRADFLLQNGCSAVPSGNLQQGGPGKLFVGGVPHNLGEEQILELLRTCGEVKSFNLVKDPGSMTSRGYCFCEYATQEQSEFAIQVLNDMIVGERKLTVRFATQPGQQPQQPGVAGGLGMQNPLLAMSNLGGFGSGQQASQGNFPSTGNYYTQQGGTAAGFGNGAAAAAVVPANPLLNVQPTRVLKLTNMVTHDDLENDAEFADIKEDVRLECQDHGAVLNVIIPRMKDGFPMYAEGSIFVEFADPTKAQSAALALNGRKFVDRSVVVQYFDEAQFSRRQLF
jgi:splicing factor U2AF subunit